MMARIDIQYFELIQKILREGVSNNGQKVSTKWKDGTPAYSTSIFFHVLTISPTEVPILTSKEVKGKLANIEKDWIWNQRSNDVNVLNQMGSKIWNNWKLEDGTIGKSYGYQLNKMMISGQYPHWKVYRNQVEYVIRELIENKFSRRIMTELWNVDDMHMMALPPCVHHTQWDATSGKLDVIVKARSSDVGLGLPFNIYQYSVLHRQIAQVTGIPLGTMHFVMGNAHIYDRHIPVLQEQMKRPIHDAPLLYINPDVKEFDDFKPSDVRLIDYQHSGPLKMEIAVHA